MTPSSNEILDRLIKLKNLKNDAGLARYLKVRPAIISNWRTRGTIPYDMLFAICELEGVTLDFIISGRGPIYSGETASLVRDAPSGHALSGVEERTRAYAPGKDEFVYISQVSGRISAGAGRVPENAVDMKVAFRREWILRKGKPENMVLIRVDGDSMEPSLVSGDLVLIDRNRNFIDPQGGIYALALEDAIMIKRVQVLSDRIRILSDNRKYEPFDVSPDKLKVNGKVIWFARELER